MSTVELHDLSVRAGSTTLISDVSLNVEAGTWCTVIGPNGAGKTTLVETVAGLRRPSKGSVSISGEPVGSMSERERAKRIALVPQHPTVPAGMSVRDYVALGRTAYHGLLRAPNALDRKTVDTVLARMTLDEFSHRDVFTLSVMVLDEPITGLDLRHQMTILELLQKEVHECGLTVLATLHDLTLAGQFADRLVLLDHGRVVLDGPSGDVVRSEELEACYGMRLRVVDVDGADVVIPVRH